MWQLHHVTVHTFDSVTGSFEIPGPLWDHNTCAHKAGREKLSPSVRQDYSLDSNLWLLPPREKKNAAQATEF